MNFLKSLFAAFLVCLIPATALGQDYPQVEIAVSEISGFMQSSKAEYKDWYLFIAKVDQATTIEDGKQFIASGTKVEMMLPKSSCAEQVKVALASGSDMQLQIKSVVKTFAMQTPDDPLHEFFLKMEPVVTPLLSQAECILVKK